MLSFKPTFSLSSFTFIKRLYIFLSLSDIRVVSSAFLRLLIFLPEILIPARASSSFTFCMMENNRMGKTKDLFKKIRDAKGTFHAEMGTIKNRNGMDLTEAEVLRRGGKEYPEELYKKDLHDPDNHDSMITHLEPDILECKVKWALGSITTDKGSRGDRIPVELFQVLKDDVVKVLLSVCQQIWKSQQWPQDWK